MYNIIMKTNILSIFAIAAIALIMLIPFPGALLDILLAVNLLLAAFFFFMTGCAKKITFFYSIPGVLIFNTIFSLITQVFSTRLILIKGTGFDGRLIRTLSSVISGSNGITGLVVDSALFIGLLLLLVTVISRQARRISETAARFTLDAIPGRQMAIDAAMSSGSISGEEAQAQKKDLQRDADFYGVMDGASEFIAGFLKLGLLVIAISITGGIAIGALLQGEDIIGAIEIYVPLSVAAGVLAQIPVLLASIAIGNIVTRNLLIARKPG